MTTRISAVGHLGRLGGGTQPHLLAASDGQYYVTKFQNNPFHIRILANELFGTRLGQHLGLPMAGIQIVDVPPALIEQTPALHICEEEEFEEEGEERLVPCCPGLQAASRYIRGGVPESVLIEDPELVLREVSNLQDFARVLAFDRWVGNADDRQAIIGRHGLFSGKYVATFVDQGDCFDAGRWGFADLPMHGSYRLRYVYTTVTGWESFEPTLSLIETMDAATIAHYAAQIPEEWYEHDSNALEKLIEGLDRRRSRLHGLIKPLHSPDYNLFPNWPL